MQGEAYGSKILDAVPFPGLMHALMEFKRRDWTILIVSHKTRTPIAGPAYDLHNAASNWLCHYGLLNTEQTNLNPENVYFELTKPEKIQRIAELECDWFIDDLPELLSDPMFPTTVRKMLFDPHRQFHGLAGVQLLHHWDDVVQRLSPGDAK